MKKEWTQNLTVTKEEQEGLKEIMAAQKARREAFKKDQAEQMAGLKEIYKQQQARRKKILGL